MTQLTGAQQSQVAAYWANINFVQAQVTANYNTADITAAVAAIDAAFDTTLNDAVMAVGGGTTIANGLSSQITASMPAATVEQQTLLVSYVLMKRAGII
jgi:hypothetical protein